MITRRIRWGDNDKHFGPLTYSKDTRYRSCAIIFSSGDDEDRSGCRLRLSGFGHTVILPIPPIVRPWRKKVHAGWDEETTKRLGRDWYWDVHEREYGISYSDGFLNISLGRQTHASDCWSHVLDNRWKRCGSCSVEHGTDVLEF